MFKGSSFFLFVVIMAHLLLLMNYLANGKYTLVHPIGSNFARDCICTILTTNKF